MRLGRRTISNPLKTAAILLFASGTALLVIGCDDPAEDMQQTMIDQQKRQQDAAKQLPKIPTTQDLLSGPRSTVALGPLPMTMNVPASWRVAVISGATNLQGWTPGGTEVAIQLSSRQTMKKEALDYAVRSAKKEQSTNPQAVLKFDVRPFGSSGAQIMERQSVGEPRDYEIMDNNGTKHITTEQPFKWTISVLSPHTDSYQVYELNFIGLTKNQYEKDKDFLNGLLETMSLSTSAAAAATAPVGVMPPPTTRP